MRVSIDAAGRVVIPKSLRDRLALRGGDELDVVERGGRIEITPVGPAIAVIDAGGLPVLTVSEDVAPLTADEVRAVLEDSRR